MARNRDQAMRPGTVLTPERIARDDAIAARYEGNPSPRELYERGDIDREAYDRVSRLRAAGPPVRPFAGLIALLRAERGRQGLSLADVAARAGMDRAAVHKLEIGLNKNPTAETLNRYAAALGKRIGWTIADGTDGPTAETGARTRGRAGRAGGGRIQTVPVIPGKIRIGDDMKVKVRRFASPKAASKAKGQAPGQKAAKIAPAAKAVPPKAAARAGVPRAAKKK